MKRFKKKGTLAVGLAATIILAAGGVALAYFPSTGHGVGAETVGTTSNLVIKQTNTVLYDSRVSPLPGSLPSEAFQATQTSEFGNEITLARSPSVLKNVTVTMESWTCGNWTTPGSTPCTTISPGSGYTVPITFTIYKAGSTGARGAPIASVTQHFNIPFRPSATSGCPHSTGTQGWLNTPVTASAFGVTPDTHCHYGLAHNITFDFSSSDVTLPTTVIYGISFNTQTYGTSPIGRAVPQTSLNVGLTTSNVGPSVGTDVYPGELDLDTSTAQWYCDDGSTGTFRLDNPPGTTICKSSTGSWSVNGGGAPYYLPAVQFNASTSLGSDLYPGGPAQPIDFSVTNPGSGNEGLNGVTISISSITNPHSHAPGTTTCKTTWFTITQPTITSTTLPGGSTIDYSSSGASIALTNEPTTQDACEGATVNLNFTSD